MAAEVLQLNRKRRSIPIPTSACVVISALGGDVPRTDYSVKLRLRTRRQGVEMWLWAPTPSGGFSWNLSAIENVWPTNFAEARKWVAAYASRYGQTVEEAIKERTPRPVGEDRKLLKAGKCKEAWLRSDVPALFGEAAVRCQHAGGFCMSDGYCHLGDCDMVMDTIPATLDEGAAEG